MLDNVEKFYNSKTKAGKWGKSTGECQDAIFGIKATSLSQIETHGCYNCGEKGVTAKSHISPQHSYPCEANSGRGQGHGGQGRGCSGGKNSKSDA
eukprot:14558752-Ditylum_brightwellii.AAC.1